MAELKVEPKRGMGWIWVVIILVVLAIVAWLLYSGEIDIGTTTTSIGAFAAVPVAPPALI
jgi:hypothetical protein